METSERPTAAMPEAPEKAPHLSISDLPVNPNAFPDDDRFGAVMEFRGVVRASEHGEPILGIRYSAYQEMAEHELAAIGSEGQTRFGTHPLVVHHTTGFVAAGDASLLIRLALPHSREAFDACRWYLAQIKQRLPIWKAPVPVDQSPK